MGCAKELFILGKSSSECVCEYFILSSENKIKKSRKQEDQVSEMCSLVFSLLVKMFVTLCSLAVEEWENQNRTHKVTTQTSGKQNLSVPLKKEVLHTCGIYISSLHLYVTHLNQVKLVGVFFLLLQPFRK